MPASAPKASAPNLYTGCSAATELLLHSTLGHKSIKSELNWVLDDYDSRPAHGCPQHDLAVLHRSAPNAYPERKVPASESLPTAGELVGRLTVS
ncbi:MAG: hypothetical protein OXK78_15255 [Caldilineaceae bacterium]|nr:hypothetical protein [Caldilineaceae bacterium]